MKLKVIALFVIIALIVMVMLPSAVFAKPGMVLGHHHLGNGSCQERMVNPNVIGNGEWEAGACDVIPTDVPTEVPTEVPTDIPTEVPTDVPTDIPTDAPTDIPTEIPTETPVTCESGFYVNDIGGCTAIDVSGIISSSNTRHTNCGDIHSKYHSNQDNSEALKYLKNHRCTWYYGGE